MNIEKKIITGYSVIISIFIIIGLIFLINSNSNLKELDQTIQSITLKTTISRDIDSISKMHVELSNVVLKSILSNNSLRTQYDSTEVKLSNTIKKAMQNAPTAQEKRFFEELLSIHNAHSAYQLQALEFIEKNELDQAVLLFKGQDGKVEHDLFANKIVDYENKQRINSEDWISSLVQSKADLNKSKESMYRLINTLLILIIITSIIAIGISAYISRMIACPIKEVTSVIDEISKGNIQAQIDPKLLGRNDELGNLSEAFNRTLVSLKLAMKMSAPELKKEKDELNTALQEKQKLEIEIKKSLKKFSDINTVLNESSLVAMTDRAGNITYVNDKFCEITKYSRDELIGQNHRILKSGFHAPDFYKEMWQTISNGQVWHGDIKNKAKDGTYYWVRSTVMPKFDANNNIEGYMAVRTPITDLKNE